MAVLLYLTLTARSGPTRRDRLLPLFWPELSEPQARHALRQILHFLDRSMPSGPVVQRAGEGLLVDLEAVSCDAIAFEQALDDGRPADALALYKGELLPGLIINDAPQFDEWLEGERARLRRRAARAASETTPTAPARRLETVDPAPSARPRTAKRWLGGAAGAFAAILLVGAIVARETRSDTGAVAATEAAHKLYELGLRAAQQSERRDAARFFLAALAEDSTSALAAYRAAISEVYFDRWAAQRDFTRAWRLAEHASDHDALTIRQSFAAATNDPRSLVLAESLVTRFPDEAEGELALGRALSWSGDFLGAVPHLRRAISIDSGSRVSPDSPDGPCIACQAYDVLVGAYRDADSLGAADRAAHAWAAAHPSDAFAWFFLAEIEEIEGKGDSAITAGRHGNTVTQTLDEAMRRVRIAIRSGAFADADRILDERARDGTPSDRLEALWWLITSLRAQGRLRDALAVTTRWQNSAPTSDEGWSASPTPVLLPEAQIQFESGRFRDAAAMWDNIRLTGRPEPPTWFFNSPSLVARHLTWMATHAATARAAAGDTIGMAAFADSIARWGSLEAYGRDQRLHFYATGLLLEARGDTTGAIDAFRRSVYSPNTGYTRAEFDAARLLVALGRPREAIALLQPTLRGGLEASNWYVTRTELHELLARAFVADGQRDSAARHYAYVATAWRRGDPSFRARAAIAAKFTP